MYPHPERGCLIEKLMLLIFYSHPPAIFFAEFQGEGEGGRNFEILKSCESALPRKGENLNF